MKYLEHDLGIEPSIGAPEARLVQSETAAYVALDVMNGERALVELVGCEATRFGYPNDEARIGHPEYQGVLYGVFEATQSSWLDEIRRINGHNFPTAVYGTGIKHFVFAFHDSTLECVARELRVILTGHSYEEEWAFLKSRLSGESS